LLESLKIEIYPIFATVLRRIGWSWKTIGNTKIGKHTLLAQAKELASHIGDPTPEVGVDKGQHFVFLTMLGGHVYNAGIDICLALCLKARGHKVDIIIDDAFLPISQRVTVGGEHKFLKHAKSDYEFARKYFGGFDLEIRKASDFQEENLPVKLHSKQEILEASMLRHYKVGLLDEKMPLYHEVKTLLMKSIELTSRIGVGIASMQPDAVIMSHGIYSTWGPPFEVLRSYNIPVLTYGRGKKAGTSKFNWNCTADWWDVSEAWKEYSKRDLTPVENKQIDEYLTSRIKQDKDVFQYNFGGLESRENTLIRFNLDANKVTYTLFTNVLWDAASAQREIVFKNPIDWVLETITWFELHPEKQLIVKIHPAEQVIGTNMPFINILRDKLNEVPNNVRIIEPREQVNSWSIYGVTDLGLVHTTTVGMELPLKGIPCVVVSKTHYRERGFTIDVKDKESYFSLLSDFEPDTVNSDRLKELSKKYAYLLFEKYQMPLNLFNERRSADVRSFSFGSLKELYNNPTMVRVVDAIENRHISILNE
jgi:hypothetical protein